MKCESKECVCCVFVHVALMHGLYCNAYLTSFLFFFPTSFSFSPTAADGTYATSPYTTYAPALSSLQGGYAATHHHSALSASQQAGNQRMPLNGTQSSLVYSDALPSSAVHQHQSSLSMNGLYGCTQKPSGLPTMTLGMSPFPVSNWSASSLVHPSGRSIAPLHSPLTGYSAEGSTHIRGHSGQALDVGDSSYSLQQHSPDQMLPECASSEPCKYVNKLCASLALLQASVRE